MTISHIEDPRADVIAERNLWHVFRKSIGLVGKPLDYIPSIVLAVVALPASYIGEYRLQSLVCLERQEKMLVTWSSLSVNFAIAILGFLIAGFSIFATLSDKELFRKLASYRRTDRSISQFKFIFFNFLYVFVIYLVVVITSAVLAVLSEENSPVDYLLHKLGSADEPAIRVVFCTVICVYLALVLHALLILRGFIWNIYASLVIAIFWQPPAPAEITGGAAANPHPSSAPR